jgi:hypothetical protein
MVGPLPSGCRLTAVYDCCHSGSALDLPYEYVIDNIPELTQGTQRSFERTQLAP